jgi:hypothetical protein
MPENTLLKSLNTVGIKPVSSEIYIWANLKKSSGSSEKLEEISTELLKELELIQNPSLSKNIEENDNFKKIEITTKDSNSKHLDINAFMEKSGNTKQEGYISVTIANDKPVVEKEDLRKKVLYVLRKFKIEPRVNYCVTGNIDGKLDYSRLNDVCKGIFHTTGATKVEGIRDENLVSLSAYSPLMEESVEVKGKKVNMNLAVRFNTNENKTYIWLATPVINIEY